MTEGSLDEAVIRRVILHFGIDVEMPHVKGGRSKIAAKVEGYYAASQISPWLVLADLDSDCASHLLMQWRVPASAPLFLCRFATREIEAWLLADRNGIARNLAVSEALVPQDPDMLPDAKSALLNLARRSRSREVKSDMLPAPGGLIKEGPGYRLRLSVFVREEWDVLEAAQSSRSLARCLSAVDAFAKRI